MKRLVLGLIVIIAPAGTGAGREGVRLLREGDFVGAAERLRSALEAGSDQDVASRPAAALRHALHHNLALAVFGQGDGVGAAASFDLARGWASDDSLVARALYDAGTALAGAERWREARDRLERSLLLWPRSDDARHNLEIVLRNIEEPEQNETGRPPEPSAFARRLKAEADSLVARQRYAEALMRLRAGLARDSTVAAFNEYMERLGQVASIVADTSSETSR